MQITRLGWAGVELAAGNETVLIDVAQDWTLMERYVGPPRTPMPAPTPGAARLALVTHLHDDHCDPGALAVALRPDGLVLRPVPAQGEGPLVAGTAVAEHRLGEHDLATRVARPWETVEAGAWRATAVPAVDGFGDPQISWVLERDGVRVLHAGDTLFHGWWWEIRERTGPIDVAFLPINGPIVSLPHRQPPTGVPAAMTPQQAAAAAAILQARLTVPVHYDAVHHPPVYAQADDPVAAFAAAARQRDMPFAVVDPGAAVSQPATSAVV